MTVIGWKAVRDFTRKHHDAVPAFERWFDAAKRASWNNLMEVRSEFPSADAVGPLTVFHIRGNRYRLIARIDYPRRIISVRAVLRHAEYDRGGWKE